MPKITIWRGTCTICKKPVLGGGEKFEEPAGPVKCLYCLPANKAQVSGRFEMLAEALEEKEKN